MAMSNHEARACHTQHAFLVVWGRFAQAIGLIEKIEAVKLKQKKYWHSPQTKVLEFLVATLAGLKHLQDISLSAHPLDRDAAVAEAWEQPGWADYSGVSRTLSALSWEEVHQMVDVLQQVSQPFLEAEIQQVVWQGKRLCFDGDLTGIPVSNTSRTYPNAAFGHMNHEIRLGYQAALVSMESPTYGRLWLSIAHHPGDTVSCTQGEALVLAAEARTGLRPRRRMDLLRQRLQAFQEQLTAIQKRLQAQHQAVAEAQARLATACQQQRDRQAELNDLERHYQAHQRQERPTSYLAKARQRYQAAQRRRSRREQAHQKAQRRLAKTQAQLAEHQAELARLQERLERFEQDNATHADPIEAEFRLDAGFGTYENVALLIEMGYEVYTKPYSHQVVRHLKGKVTEQTRWTRVGANAEMVAWSNLPLKHCPYPLDVALERFYTGTTLKHSGLLHFGTDPVTQDLPAWFGRYNARQTIEAGIKEGKQVFYLHCIKVRSEPAIYLQEAFVIFAANFIRWASHWLATVAIAVEKGLDISALGVKKQVHVAAHVSADVIRDSDGWLLKFSEYSTFAGKVLKLPGGGYLPSPAPKFVIFVPFLIESHLIAQPLR
jgi:hypothetical protein